MTTELPRLYTSAEAAAYLGISERTLARLRVANKIGHIVIVDRIYRYKEEHLLDYLDRHHQGPRSRFGAEYRSSVRDRRVLTTAAKPGRDAGSIFGKPVPMSVRRAMAAAEREAAAQQAAEPSADGGQAELRTVNG